MEGLRIIDIIYNFKVRQFGCIFYFTYIIHMKNDEILYEFHNLSINLKLTIDYI